MNSKPNVQPRKRRLNFFIPVAVIGGIALAMVTASKTFRVYQKEKEKATQMSEELNGYKKSQFKQKVNDQMLNPVQKEEEARRMGYVKPNEAPLK